VDALECDVRLSNDGHLVCVHDRRVDRTSSGRGLVSTSDLARLQGLDWGSWWRPGGAALLTLRSLLDLVRDCGRPVRLAIETKHPTRYAGQVERTLTRVLAEYGWNVSPTPEASPVRVMSFSRLAVRRSRQLMPSVPVVWLADRLSPGLRAGRLPGDVGTVGLSMEIVRKSPQVVDRVRRAGGRVHVWVVDTPEDLRRCRDARVDAVITNRPDLVLAQLGRGPRPMSP
jgi:glycerophosphoryl diester phosphodiesterase